MLKYQVCIIVMILLLGSCKSRNNELNVPGYELDTGEIELPREAIEDIIQNISSPIEMAALIKDLGVAFDSKNLTDLSRVDNYSTSFKTAYTLGMLGADLGYLNVYEKTGSSVNYLTTINQLADALKVSQFFDFNTIKRLATSNSNLDSLIFISVHSFNQMDAYLRETDRSNLSALMITGVWIEGMYQVTRVIKKEYNPDLAEFIGEQKMILKNLLLILQNYQRDEQFAVLISDYQELAEAFDDVEISYEIGEPSTIEQDGMLMVVQQETSKVTINPSTLKKIINTIEIIRDKHLNM